MAVKLPVLVDGVATGTIEDVLHSLYAREHALIVIYLINLVQLYIITQLTLNPFMTIRLVL